MSANRFITNNGRDITKTDYTKSGTDSYGDPTYSGSTSTVTAVYSLGRAGAISQAETGVRLTNTADVYLASTVNVDGPEATRASRFTLSSSDYEVVSKDVQPDLIHCHCEQIDD